MPHFVLDDKASRSYQSGALKKKDKTLSRDDPHIRLRIPEEIKQWAMEMAKANRRSMTAEIVYILETAMKKEKGEAPAS